MFNVFAHRSSTRGALAAAIVTMAALALAPRMDANAARRLTLTVIVHNYAAVSRRTLDLAERTSSRIYQTIDIDTIWVDGPAKESEESVPAEELGAAGDVAPALHVNLLSAAMEAQRPKAPGVLGFAVVGSRLAWVMCHRIDEFSRERRIAPGLVIGNVMAHEAGHLLLPSGAHSLVGIMRASLDLDALEKDTLTFTTSEAASIRARIFAEASHTTGQEDR